MIIHAPSSGTFAFFRIGQTTHISPVIIAKQHYHIIGYTQAHVIKTLYLFIYGPHLRPFISRSASHIPNDFTLIFNYLLKQVHIIFVTVDILVVCPFLSSHRGITISTHTDGYQIFSIFRTLYSFTEKTIKHLLVRRIIPYPVLPTFTRPFLMVACHRFMM